MTDRVLLRLPFPPSENEYRGIRIIRRKVRDQETGGSKVKEIPLFFLRAAGKDFLRDAAPLIRSAMKRRRVIDGPVAITAVVFFPTMRGDLLNRDKVLLDALELKDRGPELGTFGVYTNDQHIRDARFIWALDRIRPRVDLIVEPCRIDPIEWNIFGDELPAEPDPEPILDF